MKRKHTEKSAPEFPRLCDLCDSRFENSNDLKTHMKSHSYKLVKFRCTECDFVGENDLTMDVHVGRYHAGDFECGLCENKFESLESLEVHLQTCEKFKCRLCELTGKTLSELKKHTKDRHKDAYQGGMIYHIKLDRINFKDVTYTGHWSHDI